MKIYTSYFYQVRNFKPNMVPFSTAVWDPQWFHAFQGPRHVFQDKNGVYNGIRATPLHPDHSCDGLCSGRATCPTGNPYSCEFLKAYRKQLDALDIKDILSRIERILNVVQSRVGFKEEPVAVLLVHEAQDNQCSERRIIQEWFTENGVSIEELPYPVKNFF